MMSGDRAGGSSCDRKRCAADAETGLGLKPDLPNGGTPIAPPGVNSACGWRLRYVGRASR
jgi:hypothetical protein